MAALLAFAALLAAQSNRRRPDKGPRALGLLQVLSNGKARLTPVAIMTGGNFYDAGSFKASPVPMALEPGVVYEGLRTGVSQGLFTIDAARPTGNSWIGEGTWVPAGSEPVKKKQEGPAKPPDEDISRPPVLRRPDAAKAKAPDEPPAAAPAATPPQTSTPPPAAAPPAPPAPSPASTEAEDPNRPVLRRGKAEPSQAEEESPPPAAAAAVHGKTPVKSAGAASPTNAPMIVAISDASGPDPRPYDYELKPEEEATYRKKTLAMASMELRKRMPAAEPEPASRKKTARAPKPAQPTFEDVKMRVFDLSNSNEPVVVLTATATMPHSGSTESDLHYYVTLVATSDLYGDLNDAFSKVTDSRHLDGLPRFEFIDAVDADGDGRGELLFREVFDSGKAFAIYRVIGNQLWALYEGTP